MAQLLLRPGPMQRLPLYLACLYFLACDASVDDEITPSEHLSCPGGASSVEVITAGGGDQHFELTAQGAAFRVQVKRESFRDLNVVLDLQQPAHPAAHQAAETLLANGYDGVPLKNDAQPVVRCGSSTHVLLRCIEGTEVRGQWTPDDDAVATLSDYVSSAPAVESAHDAAADAARLSEKCIR